MKRTLPHVGLFVLVAGVYLVGGFEFLEHRLMDLRFRLAERPPSSELALVAIDSKSLGILDVWPWDRGYHATVIENLIESGARDVGVDVDFSSRSVADQDQELEQALEAARGRVVLPVFHQWEPKGGLVATRPLPAFARNVRLGTINIRPGPDGLVRRYWSRGPKPGEEVPSFAAALLKNPKSVFEGFYLDFGIAAGSIPRISYVDLLTGQFDPALVKDKTVIIGPTAVELGDQVAVPMMRAMPGPLLQALAFESLAQGRALRRTGAVTTLVVALLLALVLGPWLVSSSWRMGLIAVAGVSLVSLAVSLVVQSFAPRIVDIAPWMATLVLAYGHGLVRRIDQQALGLLMQGKRIKRTEDLMHHVVQNSFDAILTITEDGTVDTVNRAANRMFGYAGSHRLVGSPFHERVLLSEEALPADLLRNNEGPHEAMGRRRDGSTFPLEMTVSTITTDGSRRRVVFLRDITERKSQQEALEHQATHDALTNLPNRFLLRERVREALASAWEDRCPVAFLILDLDRFKEINDALGHHTGDLLLQKIAKHLLKPLRPSDTIARFGGDEFAVLLPATDLTVARKIAWSLIGALESPFLVEGMSLQVDTSIGIALFPDHGTDAATLIQRADVAMYVAKNSRSGVVVYDSEQDYNSIRHLKLTGQLRGALEKGDLSLQYQPKVAADTERVVGVEALLRWQHPEHGNIPPDEFIGLAEHSGLIRPLTLWVLETALRQSADWKEQGIDIGLSVNLSARNLLEEDLPATLERLLKVTGIPPRSLSLEITESVIMEDPEKALEVLIEIATLGVGVSIDDFGTGYSSLGYLRKLPAREIKIDKSFILEMDRNQDDANIVRSTIELAHNLGLRVVAEGVETQEVWRELQKLGCDFGQGYFLGRPMPAGKITRRLKTSGPDLALACG